MSSMSRLCDLRGPRRARNKYVSQYRRTASAWVAEHGFGADQGLVALHPARAGTEPRRSVGPSALAAADRKRQV